MIMNRAIFKLSSLVNTVRYGAIIGRIIPVASLQQTRLSSESEVIDGIQPTEPPIPQYVAKEGEATEHKRARLLYQSRKRGMLENDLVLSTFASRYLTGMNESQLELYDKLINEPSNDWDLYYWIIGHKPTPAEYDHEIMNLLKEHALNKDKESRIRQPDL